MSYSARQQYCLNIMGLVAWTSVRRASGEATPATSGKAAVVDTVVEQNSHPAPLEGASHDGSTLAQWLVEQALVPFNFRGNSVSCVGSEQAILVVVCLHRPEMDDGITPDLPLTQDCASLLNQMMRAIDLPAAAIRQCVMRSREDNETAPETAPETAKQLPKQLEKRGQGLEVVVTPTVKAVLVLDTAELWLDDDKDYELLPGSSLPMWRIPHPRILLAETSLKRRAWKNLKALKQAL